MAKYRKLPVEIEAFLYDGDLKDKNGYYYVPNWAIKAFNDGMMYYNGIDLNSPPCELFVKTLEGKMHVSVGDYIIKGINGELYPCKPDIFEKTYKLSDIEKKYEEMNEFKEICQPVVDYLNKNYHHHATIVITQTSAEVVEGVMAVPFEPID